MKRHYFTTTSGKRSLHTEQEIDMVHYFESQGIWVDEISTDKAGVVTMKTTKGDTYEYLPLSFE